MSDPLEDSWIRQRIAAAHNDVMRELDRKIMHNLFDSEPIATLKQEVQNGTLSLEKLRLLQAQSFRTFGYVVYTSDFLGEQVTPQPPRMCKGPYYRRRLKRWYRKHPPYTIGNGSYLITDRNTIWCHPDDYMKLKSALAHLRLADSIRLA